MKAKDLIVILAELDPDTELVANDCIGFGCMGGLVSGIVVNETRLTEWDHRLKKPVHRTVYQIKGEE